MKDWDIIIIFQTWFLKSSLMEVGWNYHPLFILQMKCGCFSDIKMSHYSLGDFNSMIKRYSHQWHVFCVNLFTKKLKYNLGRVRRISGIVQYYSRTCRQDLIILLVRFMFALKGLSKPNMKSKQGLKRVYVIKWIIKGNRSIWDVACVASKYWSMGLKCKCNLTEIIALC